MELPKSIIWAPEADEDLLNTINYLETNWSFSVVQNFIQNLFETLDWIATGPRTFMQLDKSDHIRKYVLSEHHTLYFEIA
jgi:plasmid stabilization system protein ParE